MRAATEGNLPPVMPQGNLVEVLGREVRQGSPGELMVESSPSRQRRPPCKRNKEMSDDAADTAALTYLLTRTNQSTTYTKEDPYHDKGTNKDELYDMQDWSYSNQPPSYDQVHRPESLWQPYYMEGYENELETVDELQHLGEFGMKLPY